MSSTDRFDAAEAAKRYPRGIRFQMSILLLISTLNGLALAALLIFMFTTLQGGRGDSVGDLREVSASLAAAHDAVVVASATGELPPIEGLREQIRRVEGTLSGLGVGHKDPALQSLGAYRAAAEGWWGLGWGDGPTGDVPKDEAERRLRAFSASHRALLGELALLGEGLRPPWFYSLVTWARWGLLWVLAVAGVTVFMAVRLQKVLSLPLERLTLATERVGEGDLTAEIPRVASMRMAPEIVALGRSVEAMRGRLVASIRELDGRNAELAALLNSLTEGVLVLDAAGCIIEASPRVRELLAGREDGGAEPIPTQPLRDVLPGLPPGPLGGHLGQIVNLSVQLSRARQRHLSLTLSPLQRIDPEMPGAFVAVLRDITHLKEVEDLKSEFLSVVTHELKTPLTAIEGYAKLLLMGKGGTLSEKQQGFARTITDQTLVLRSMIQNLLDTSRLEGGNLPIDPVEVEPEALVIEAVESFRASATTRGITLTAAPAIAAGARVLVDPFRMQQVFGNLISNALKFTAEGGEVQVSAGLSGERVYFEVRDTGRGIPEEALPHLFEKFYQVAKGDTRNAGGAGLGLFICRELVEAQGGTIAASSDPGEGSTFHIGFPRAATARDAAAPTTPLT